MNQKTDKTVLHSTTAVIVSDASRTSQAKTSRYLEYVRVILINLKFYVYIHHHFFKVSLTLVRKEIEIAWIF